MKKLIIILFLFAMLIPAGLLAEESDTLWTKQLWKFGHEIKQIQFTPDGQHIAIALGGAVYILDKNTGNFVKQFNRYMTSCNSFVIFEDKNWLVTTSDRNRVIVWDYTTADTIRIFNNITLFSIKRYGENSIIGIGNTIKWGNEDSTRLDVFNVVTGEIEKRERPKTPNLKYVYSLLEISEGNNILALQSYDWNINTYQIELIDLPTLKSIGTINSSVTKKNDIAFSPDGKYLASADAKEIIKIWDLETNTLVKTLVHLPVELMDNLHLKFSPKGGYLISSGNGELVFKTKIWNMKTFDVIYEYPPLYTATTAGICISSDSSMMLLGRSSFLFALKAHWVPTSVGGEAGEIKHIYPNPATDYIDVILSERSEAKTAEGSGAANPFLSVKVYDVLGVCVLTHPLAPSREGESVRLDVSGLAAGVYFVRVGGRMYKFVKM